MSGRRAARSDETSFSRKVCARPGRQVLQRREIGDEQPEQVEERVLVAAVGSGRQQHQVAVAVFGQALEQLVALLPPLAAWVQVWASSTMTNSGQKRWKASRRRSDLM
jgi:hypothetical protein